MITYSYVTDRWSRFPWDGWDCNDDHEDGSDCVPPFVTRPIAHNGTCPESGTITTVNWKEVDDEAEGYIEWCNDCDDTWTTADENFIEAEEHRA